MTDFTPLAGKFIVLEGIDGCGKTTQIEAIRSLIPPKMLVVTKEPGGSDLGQAIRGLLLNSKGTYAEPGGMAELLLYAADRAQHVEQIIRPALADGKCVLCDRYTASTYAYQGHGRGMPMLVIKYLSQVTTNGLKADLTLWLDLAPKEAFQRMSCLDRMEQNDLAFFERVSDAFKHLWLNRSGWERIDASLPANEVTELAWGQICKHFKIETAAE